MLGSAYRLQRSGGLLLALVSIWLSPPTSIGLLTKFLDHLEHGGDVFVVPSSCFTQSFQRYRHIRCSVVPIGMIADPFPDFLRGPTTRAKRYRNCAKLGRDFEFLDDTRRDDHCLTRRVKSVPGNIHGEARVRQNAFSILGPKCLLRGSFWLLLRKWKKGHSIDGKII